MYVVTGGAGFIGSRLIKALNREGHTDILLVDDLSQGIKFRNIVDCEIMDYIDKDDFIGDFFTNDDLRKEITAVFHQGACSTTTEWDGRYMMKNNYEYSKDLLHACLEFSIPFIYASSAAVYGASSQFDEDPVCEKPLNVYGYSKLQFDRYVRKILPQVDSQIVGLRYFNVYGPHESHKGSMASVMWHFHKQLKQKQRVELFEGIDGYENGEQRRDFIFVDDVANINLWFLKNPTLRGIYNVGTGQSRSFNDVANTLIQEHGSGQINYIPFPEQLVGAYQNFTEADISKLREAGYQEQFTSLENGIKTYKSWLDSQ